MDVIHHIGVRATEADIVDLRRFGVAIEAGLTAFDVAETSPHWDEIRVWIERRRSVDVVYTRFTDAELESASWLAMQSSGQAGYPETNPDDDGYLAATYDLSEFCEACGIGLRQKEPFRFKKDPKLRRTSIRQLNWVFDEYFVHRELWEAVFRPRGIERRPVVNIRGAEIDAVVQLVVDATVPIETQDLPYERCQRCDRVKYQVIVKGAFPRVAELPKTAMVKTSEWFGSGGSAYRAVLVSQDVRRGLLSEGARGVHFIPVATSAE